MQEVLLGRNADAIAEGVAIATAAARLAVKNHILVGTIAQGGTFDLDKYTQDTRDALEAMAAESEEAAELLTKLRKKARGRHSDPSGTHDYRDRDVRNLRRRAKQSIGVATKLRELADDPEAVQALVESARRLPGAMCAATSIGVCGSRRCVRIKTPITSGCATRACRR